MAVLTALSIGVQMVEIEAKFVEFNEGALEELGFDWTLYEGTGLEGETLFQEIRFTEIDPGLWELNEILTFDEGFVPLARLTGLSYPIFDKNPALDESDLLATLFAGDDLISSGDAEDLIRGFAGKDTINSGAGNDLIYGNLGSDTVSSSDGDDTIYGGQNDGPASLDILGRLKAMEGIEYIDGGGGNDLIYGQFGDEYILAGSGNDTVYGGQGDDSILGTTGDNLVFGNRGDDYILVGDGSDTVWGGGGKDWIDAIGGNDLIYGNQGSDTIVGGPDNDTIYGGQNDGPASLDVLGQLKAMEGTEYIDGGDGNDLIYGNYGDESILGGADDDKLYGGQGDDTLVGGDGSDDLYGNRDDDFLSGGEGLDNFHFRGEFGDDIVTDFELGIDIAIVDATVTLTDTSGGDTTFFFEGGSSIKFEGVTMDADDLIFI
jgi:Ca2+-binding RTX toxin-like protein